MKIFEIQPNAKIIEPAVDGDNPEVIYIGQKFIALMDADKFPKGTKGLKAVDHKKEEIRDLILNAFGDIDKEDNIHKINLFNLVDDNRTLKRQRKQQAESIVQDTLSIQQQIILDIKSRDSGVSQSDKKLIAGFFVWVSEIYDYAKNHDGNDWPDLDKAILDYIS